MDKKIIEIMQNDIQRCEEQKVNEGSYELFQSLTTKYNGIFPGFSNDIQTMGKVTAIGQAANYRSELNAVKEKLELLLVTEQVKDPLFQFKEMMSSDIDEIKQILDNYDSTDEKTKQRLYSSITAKYHPYVPQLGDGLYQYYAEQGFYDEVSGSSLEYNLRNIYNKLLTFRSLDYPGLGAVVTNTPNTVVNIKNSNENNNTISVTFNSVREKVNGMTSLPDEDIEEIQKKINELEEIVNSQETKNKKWSKAKDVIKWVADKGVDVGIALLPLILKIG